MTDDQKADYYSDETATFGDRIAGARDLAGIGPKDLAKKLGVKLSTLRSWEDDLAEPRAHKLQHLSGILGVSMRWLLTGDGDGPSEPVDAGDDAENISAILAEMRGLRVQMAQNADHLATLEKRLRGVFRHRP